MTASRMHPSRIDFMPAMLSCVLEQLQRLRSWGTSSQLKRCFGLGSRQSGSKLEARERGMRLCCESNHFSSEGKTCKFGWLQAIATRFSRLVFIKSSSTLLSQPARVHHLDQQRAGTILGIAQAILQHSHDVEANIQSDEIRQGQRPHGMRHT